jgi:hypothetical protein
MAHKKKHGKSKHRKGGKKRHRHSMLGSIKKAGAAIGSPEGTTASNALAALAGFAAANFGGRMLDKITLITPGPDETGVVATLKRLVKPVLLLGGGLAAAHYGKKNAFVKHLGYGVMIGGGVSLVKAFTKAPIFDGGLGNTGAIEAKYYEDAKEQIAKMLSGVNFNPELPALNENKSIELGGLGEARNGMSLLDFQNMDSIV